jgi:hypothetical protein
MAQGISLKFNTQQGKKQINTRLCSNFHGRIAAGYLKKTCPCYLGNGMVSLIAKTVPDSHF